MTTTPAVPTAPTLDPSDKRTKLYENLQSVLAGLPAFFEFDSSFSGINATDLHALNGLLGASIESQVVKALNIQRPIWDPDNEWLGYAFERQSQRFPDVRLARKGSGGQVDIALGIELKGWFLLSKEGVPSFRFATTPAACAEHDLLVVLPWYLDNVLAGAPVAAEPWVVSAKWAAEFRNHWWEHVRDTKADRTIKLPAGAAPYPTSDAKIADVPGHDGGGNFGRLARVTGLMDDFITQSLDTEVLGIRIRDWYLFLRMHSDQADLDAVSARLQRELKAKVTKRSDSDAQLLTSMVRMMGQVIQGNP